MLLFDTKRPRLTVLAPVALSNNSRVAEVHVSGATLENTFSAFKLFSISFLLSHTWVTDLFSSEGKIGDLYGAYAVLSLGAVKTMKPRQGFLQRCIGSSSTLYGRSVLQWSLVKSLSRHSLWRI